MMKKIIITVMAFLGSANIFAAHGDETILPSTTDVNLIAPYQSGSWSFGVQANYFQSNNDFNYAVETIKTSVSTPPTTNGQTRTDAVGTDNQWGWGADITYHFPGNGRDVTLAFTQLNSSNSDYVSTGIPNQTTSFMPIGSGPIAGTYDDASGKVTTNYDAVDLSFGQVMTVGNRVSLHPFAGVRYAYIDYQAMGVYNELYPNTIPTEIENIGTQTLKSTFNGVGPRFGNDAIVTFSPKLSLRGTLGVSVLVGGMDAKNEYTFTTYKQFAPGQINHATTESHNMDTNIRVVPEVDAKLAALYQLDSNSSYNLGLEVGYQVTNYFNAILNNTQDDTTSTAPQYTNFFMQGPYARLQLDMA